MSIMKSAFKRINVLYLIIALLIASCVNKIGDEIKEGNIPISFSVKTSKTTTKAAKSAFETGDRTGVFAMLTGNSLDKQRYIDNLLLECGEGSKLIPKKKYTIRKVMPHWISSVIIRIRPQVYPKEVPY